MMNGSAIFTWRGCDGGVSCAFPIHSHDRHAVRNKGKWRSRLHGKDGLVSGHFIEELERLCIRTDPVVSCNDLLTIAHGK